ncbi:MAG TPA: hypothetical protein VF773_16805 [Verrucomicrobiae bacterium]
MSTIQKFFMAALPRRWAESMRAESMQWQIRCCTCGTSRSYWEIGGIRWKAASRGKRIMVHCPKCDRFRVAAVEKFKTVESA